jgi:hypothetical protein
VEQAVEVHRSFASRVPARTDAPDPERVGGYNPGYAVERTAPLLWWLTWGSEWSVR